MTDRAQYVDAMIHEDAARIIELADRLGSMPEAGFREFRTADLLARELQDSGATVETGLAVSGVRGSIGPTTGTELVLVADMDALPTSGAPGGIAHSCGHNAQMAIMLSVFRAMSLTGIPQAEGIRLVFLGAPAEEYVNLDYRLGLRREGKIRLLSGKQEFIRLGLFDSAAAVLKYHSMCDSPARIATVNGELNGFMAKRATFTGKAAHAGAEPHRGVNALNAATIAQVAINAQRETFQDRDRVRVHPIFREGGTTVNIVPERAVIETYVRAATTDAVFEAAAKVDRSFAAGAIAVGARLRIEDTPGYQPLRTSPFLGEILGRAATARIDRRQVDFEDKATASDDIGDVSAIAATAHLSVSGFGGTIHAADFSVSDKTRAFVLPALILAEAACELAAARGAKAREAAASFIPRWSREEYVRMVESLFRDVTIEWSPTETASQGTKSPR